MRPWNDSVTFLCYVAIHIHLDMLKPKKITSWMVGVGYKIKYLSLPRRGSGWNPPCEMDKHFKTLTHHSLSSTTFIAKVNSTLFLCLTTSGDSEANVSNPIAKPASLHWYHISTNKWSNVAFSLIFGIICINEGQRNFEIMWKCGTVVHKSATTM